MTKKLSALLLAVLLAVACACATPPPATIETLAATVTASPSPSSAATTEAAVAALLQARAAALEMGDVEAFVASASPQDALLRREEENLARSAAGMEGLRCTARLIPDTLHIRQAYMTALVEWRYETDALTRVSQMEMRFEEIGGILYFAGYLPESRAYAQFTVRFTPALESSAKDVVELQNEILLDYKNTLSVEPGSKMGINLYDDHTAFLQTIKIDLPDWVGGWQEAGESIKLFTQGGALDGSWLQEVLYHETAHCIVSSLSGDNAAYWLQEGIAESTQGGLTRLREGGKTAKGDYLDFDTLCAQDLEALDSAGATRYYASAQAYVAYLIDTYGWDALVEAMEAMAQSDTAPGTAAEKIAYNNKITADALASSLGCDMDGLTAALDDWLG